MVGFVLLVLLALFVFGNIIAGVVSLVLHLTNKNYFSTKQYFMLVFVLMLIGGIIIGGICSGM